MCSDSRVVCEWLAVHCQPHGECDTEVHFVFRIVWVSIALSFVGTTLASITQQRQWSRDWVSCICSSCQTVRIRISTWSMIMWTCAILVIYRAMNALRRESSGRRTWRLCALPLPGCWLIWPWRTPIASMTSTFRRPGCATSRGWRISREGSSMCCAMICPRMRLLITRVWTSFLFWLFVWNGASIWWWALCDPLDPIVPLRLFQYRFPLVLHLLKIGRYLLALFLFLLRFCGWVLV